MKLEDMEYVQDEDENLDITINEEKVRNKLLQLQEDKAQGPDDTHPAVLRNRAGIVLKPLSTTFTPGRSVRH